MPDGAKWSTQGSYGLKKCYDPGDAIVESIIFVHGLTGNRETTWTDKASGTFWPEALLKHDIPEARVATFGYDADVVHFWSMASQNRVGNHARNLLNVLSQLRERTETVRTHLRLEAVKVYAENSQNERPLIFVGHSLGGIVIEDAILASKNSAEPHLRQLLESTIGIAFLGTPHCGADLAHWAKIGGNITSIFKTTNSSLLETLKPTSEVLARIQTEFHTMMRARQDDGKRKVLISCFYEELPVRGIGQIVPMHSAILPAYNSIGIRNNHMDMTKFVSEEDPGYAAVATELWRWVKEVKARMRVAPHPNARTMVDQSQQFRSPEWSADASSRQQLLLPGNHPLQYQQDNSHLAFQQHHPPITAFTQGGNVIEGQRNAGSAKVVQGNNIRSEQDVTFNF